MFPVSASAPAAGAAAVAATAAPGFDEALADLVGRKGSGDAGGTAGKTAGGLASSEAAAADRPAIGPMLDGAPPNDPAAPLLARFSVRPAAQATQQAATQMPSVLAMSQFQRLSRGPIAAAQSDGSAASPVGLADLSTGTGAASAPGDGPDRGTPDVKKPDADDAGQVVAGAAAPDASAAILALLDAPAIGPGATTGVAPAIFQGTARDASPTAIPPAITSVPPTSAGVPPAALAIAVVDVRSHLAPATAAPDAVASSPAALLTSAAMNPASRTPADRTSPSPAGGMTGEGRAVAAAPPGNPLSATAISAAADQPINPIRPTGAKAAPPAAGAMPDASALPPGERDAAPSVPGGPSPVGSGAGSDAGAATAEAAGPNPIATGAPDAAAAADAAQPVVRAIADAVGGALTDAATGPAAQAPSAAAAPVPGMARTLTLQLSPANLGTVDVRLHVIGQNAGNQGSGGRTLDVELAVSDRQTLGMVSRERDALADALRSDGYELHSLVIRGADAPSGTERTGAPDGHQASLQGQANGQGDGQGNGQAGRQADGGGAGGPMGGRGGGRGGRQATDERGTPEERGGGRAAEAADAAGGALFV